MKQSAPDFSPNLPALLAALRGGLIVSCQALPGEALFGSDIMARLATAARAGGAVGIRANTPPDIGAIRAAVPDLPLIGLWKIVVAGFEDVYITPRVEDAAAVAHAGADIIAVDATARPHPDGKTAADLIQAVKKTTGQLVMADISTFDEAVAAEDAGADVVSTTLSGYTPYSPQQDGPDLDLVAALASRLRVPLVAEGRVAMPSQARAALDAGAFAVVVGGAITRPQQIAARFAQALRP